MPKTELTKEIERALYAWAPPTIGGIDINKFRNGIASTEVVVDCGSVKGGIIDFVTINESLENWRESGSCSLRSYEPGDSFVDP